MLLNPNITQSSFLKVYNFLFFGKEKILCMDFVFTFQWHQTEEALE